MLGNAALAAAVGYTGTVMFFTNSINIGLSIAAGAPVARAAGASHETEAREYASNVAIFGILTGIALPVLMLSNLDSLLDFLGATGEVRRLAIRYCGFVLPSMVDRFAHGKIEQSCASSRIRAQLGSHQE